ISASALGAKSYWPVAPLIPFATIFVWSVGICPPAQLRHFHGLPHRMRHFRLGDIAVRPRGAGAVLDDPGAFEVVYVPGLEAVLVRSIGDHEVVEREAGALYAERTESAVRRKFSRGEADLLRRAGRKRIQLSDSRVQLRLCGQDRAGNL